MFGAPGDVVLVVRAAVTDPAHWIRRGAELAVEVRLTLAETLLGWERRWEDHPSGRPLHVVWRGGAVREGEVLRVPGWGMPVRLSGATGGGLGDLRLICRVEGGGTWTAEQIAALRSVWPEWQEPVGGDGSVIAERA